MGSCVRMCVVVIQGLKVGWWVCLCVCLCLWMCVYLINPFLAWSCVAVTAIGSLEQSRLVSKHKAHIRSSHEWPLCSQYHTSIQSWVGLQQCQLPLRSLHSRLCWQQCQQPLWWLRSVRLCCPLSCLHQGATKASCVEMHAQLLWDNRHYQKM